jgi:hypothetical protein
MQLPAMVESNPKAFLIGLPVVCVMIRGDYTVGIRSVQIRGFRSIANSSLDKCGPLNILIGKNNAGKSNVLAAIELVLVHLGQGRVAGSWPVPRRPKGEFTERNVMNPLRLAIEFDLPPDINEGLRARLTKEAPF